MMTAILIVFGVLMVSPLAMLLAVDYLAQPRRRLKRGRLLSTLHDDAVGTTHNSLPPYAKCGCCGRGQVNLVVRNAGFVDMPVCGGCVQEAFPLPHEDEVGARRAAKRRALEEPDAPAKKMPHF